MITLVSFGYGHNSPPIADLTLDLRPFRDPHVDPNFRLLTARDQAVVDKVANTPGIADFLKQATGDIELLATGRDITVATGCVGGRHRGAAAGILLGRALEAAGHQVRLVHRDIDKPVISR